MRHAIQTFLKAFNNIGIGNKSLYTNRAIDIVERSIPLAVGIDPVWIYNYTLQSDGSKILENCATGLILNRYCDIVSTQIERYYDIEDSRVETIDLTSSIVEKDHGGIDIAIFGYKDYMFMSTHRDIFSAIGDTPKTPDTLCMESLYNKLSDMYTDAYRPFRHFGIDEELHCWIFEFCPGMSINGIDNPIFLKTIIRKDTLEELSIGDVETFAKEFGFSRPENYKIYSKTDLINLANTLDIKDPGYNIIDSNGKRAYYKNKANVAYTKLVRAGKYVKTHHIANVVLESTNISKTIDNLPQYSQAIRMLHDSLSEILHTLDIAWVANHEAKSRKKFAEGVRTIPFNNMLFDAYKGKIDFNSCLGAYIKPHKLAQYATEKFGSKLLDSIK